jgi:TolA-binding protein
MRRTFAISLLAIGLGLVGWAPGADPVKPDDKKAGDLPPAATSDVELVERANSARKEYENSLKKLWEHYRRTGDKQRIKWVEEELMGFHLLHKPSYNLDVQDVPPPSLEAKTNVREANDLYKAAMEYKGKGIGNDYVLNMRRAELLLREILEKYPSSDKISDVAYQLGEIYESRAYKQFDRAARYYERSFQWKKGTSTDARLRAAVLYDKQLNERGKATALYKDVVEHDTDPERIKIAEKRLTELTGGKK